MPSDSQAKSKVSVDLQEEVNANYAVFAEKLPDLLGTHLGKFALMRHGEIIEFFDTARDAYVAGQKLYLDHLFSVQEVIEAPADLGFFSHALPQR
ncbi:MAG: hypothetical protein Q8R92_09135 [Deltaproteobacteria bacterium]|nr:hypothetical protein [Deltaproteobacteria bacterium]